MNDPQDSCGLGCSNKMAIDAERSAVYWLLAWAVQLPKQSCVKFFVDNLAAGCGASGRWSSDVDSTLAVKLGELAQVVEARHQLEFEHVKSHSLQPQNEVVDRIAAYLSEADQLPFLGEKDAIRTVAGFDNFKLMWYWHFAGTSLPHISDNGIVYDVNPPSEKSQPTLVRNESLRSTIENDVCTKLTCATYNVLTLKARDDCPSAYEASFLIGKVGYLAAQMQERKIHILALQECRSRESGIYEMAGVCRVVAAGTPEGTHGVEIWFNKSAIFGESRQKTIRFDKGSLTVRHADPRLLVVSFEIESHSCVLINCHAPQESDRKPWWETLAWHVGRVREHEQIVILGDLNARMPEQSGNQVGTLLCDKNNGNTKFVYDFLKDRPLFVPSTFEELHNGPIETWRHSSGKMSRLDYCILQLDSWDRVATSAWPKLDSGTSILDHFPLGIDLVKRWPSTCVKAVRTPIDRAHIGDPRNQSRLCKIVSDIPLAKWDVHPTDQVDHLVQALDETSFAFPFERPEIP